MSRRWEKAAGGRMGCGVLNPPHHFICHLGSEWDNRRWSLLKAAKNLRDNRCNIEQSPSESSRCSNVSTELDCNATPKAHHYCCCDWNRRHYCCMANLAQSPSVTFLYSVFYHSAAMMELITRAEERPNRIMSGRLWALVRNALQLASVIRGTKEKHSAKPS